MRLLSRLMMKVNINWPMRWRSENIAPVHILKPKRFIVEFQAHFPARGSQVALPRASFVN